MTRLKEESRKQGYIFMKIKLNIGEKWDTLPRQIGIGKNILRRKFSKCLGTTNKNCKTEHLTARIAAENRAY